MGREGRGRGAAVYGWWGRLVVDCLAIDHATPGTITGTVKGRNAVQEHSHSHSRVDHFRNAPLGGAEEYPRENVSVET